MDIASWFESQEGLMVWMLGVSLITFLGTLVAIPAMVVWMSPDYFVKVEISGLPKTSLRIFGRAIKNLLGLVFLTIGVAMLLLPGQGLLTIFVGLGLLDFPGKRKLELGIIRLRGVRDSIDWLRHKANKEPLEIPHKDLKSKTE
jgi:hypothetical protein